MVSRACLSRIPGRPLPSWCMATHAACCILYAVGGMLLRVGCGAHYSLGLPSVQSCNAVRCAACHGHCNAGALCGCQVFGSVVIVTFAPSSDVELTMELLLS